LSAHFLIGRRHREARRITGNLPPISLSARFDFRRSGREMPARLRNDARNRGHRWPIPRVWHADSADVYVAETDEFRLIVCSTGETGGSMWFLVLRRGRNSVPDNLIASGVTDTKQAAMAAAEQRADRRMRQGVIRRTGLLIGGCRRVSSEERERCLSELRWASGYRLRATPNN
jgi:hypothetical protein